MAAATQTYKNIKHSHDWHDISAK